MSNELDNIESMQMEMEVGEDRYLLYPTTFIENVELDNKISVKAELDELKTRLGIK